MDSLASVADWLWEHLSELLLGFLVADAIASRFYRSVDRKLKRTIGGTASDTLGLDGSSAVREEHPGFTGYDDLTGSAHHPGERPIFGAVGPGGLDIPLRLSLDEATLDIIIDLGFAGPAPASIFSELIIRYDEAFRRFCEHKNLPFDGLDIVAIGSGSLWARLRPRFRRRSKNDPYKYSRGSYRLALATFVMSLAGPSQPNSHQIAADVANALRPAIEAGARDAVISGCGQRVTYPISAHPNAQLRSTMEAMLLEFVLVNGEPFAVTDLAPTPLPVQDQRPLGPPIFPGQTYQGFVRIVRDTSGHPIALQLHDAVELRSVDGEVVG